jgi:peptidoglycan/LPS O-acetylase OafA/YrhL
MKKGIIVLIVAVLVLLTTGLWLFKAQGTLKSFDVFTFAIIALVVAFAVFVGYKRLTSARRGEPAEDELSKKVLLKTAAWSYYISLYMWVGMLFIKDRVKLDTEELIGTGILGMAVSFAVCWLVFNFRGIKNE